MTMEPFLFCSNMTKPRHQIRVRPKKWFTRLRRYLKQSFKRQGNVARRRVTMPPSAFEQRLMHGFHLVDS